jgi:hypothetical protein
MFLLGLLVGTLFGIVAGLINLALCHVASGSDYHIGE